MQRAVAADCFHALCACSLPCTSARLALRSRIGRSRLLQRHRHAGQRSASLDGFLPLIDLVQLQGCLHPAQLAGRDHPRVLLDLRRVGRPRQDQLLHGLELGGLHLGFQTLLVPVRAEGQHRGGLHGRRGRVDVLARRAAVPRRSTAPHRRAPHPRASSLPSPLAIDRLFALASNVPCSAGELVGRDLRAQRDQTCAAVVSLHAGDRQQRGEIDAGRIELDAALEALRVEVDLDVDPLRDVRRGGELDLDAARVVGGPAVDAAQRQARLVGPVRTKRPRSMVNSRDAQVHRLEPGNAGESRAQIGDGERCPKEPWTPEWARR